jgi:subtilisin family serine protease
MKRLSVIFLAVITLLATTRGAVHAARKPWQRRPGVVLYQLKADASSAQHSAFARTIARRPIGEDEEDLAQDLLNTGAVVYAEPDYLMPAAALPNDPGFPAQWHHSAIHSQAAWDITTGATSVIVAVCDTGIDATHPDLAANMALPGYNSADGTTNTSPVADHGTGVAGVIDASGNNGAGGAGVAWNVKILPVRVTNNADASAWCSDMSAGVMWAADHGAKVINLSYDITGCPNTINTAAQYAKGRGAVTFVAAGNDGIDLSGFFPPSHAFILVGATDSSGQRTSFSNFGSPIDLVAPGVSIYTTFPGTVYAGGTGTSFSAPMSAGVAALLFSLNPAWTPDQIRLLTLAAARPASVQNGFGQLDAAAAVASARDVLAGAPMPVLPGKPGSGSTQGNPDLNAILAYPNPWRADRHAGIPLILDNLTADSAVKIFTLSGYLVRTLTTVQNKASWDLKNDSGDFAASGLYIYSVNDSQGHQTQGKIAIIR